jgi:hypothetical protein
MPLSEFGTFPDRVSKMLRDAGWKPGYNRRLALEQRRRRWAFLGRFRGKQYRQARADCERRSRTEHPLATAILDELDWLTAEGDSRDGPFIKHSIMFGYRDASVCFPDEDIELLASILQRPLCPIGEIRSLSIVCVTELGEVFQVGWVGPGVIYEGMLFGGALQRILCGHLGTVVRFTDEQDPRHVLDYGALLHDIPLARIATDGTVAVDKWMDDLPL